MAEDEEVESLNAPLIDDRPVSHNDDDDDDDGDDNNNSVSRHENGASSLNAFIWALTFTAGISGLLFGYECVAPSLSVLSCLEKKLLG